MPASDSNPPLLIGGNYFINPLMLSECEGIGESMGDMFMPYAPMLSANLNLHANCKSPWIHVWTESFACCTYALTGSHPG